MSIGLTSCRTEEAIVRLCTNTPSVVRKRRLDGARYGRWEGRTGAQRSGGRGTRVRSCAGIKR